MIQVSEALGLEKYGVAWDGRSSLPCEKTSPLCLVFASMADTSLAMANESGIYHPDCADRGVSVGFLPCVVDQICPTCGHPIVEEQDYLAPEANIFTGEEWRMLERVEAIGRGEANSGNWPNWNWYQTREWRSSQWACAEWTRFRHLHQHVIERVGVKP